MVSIGWYQEYREIFYVHSWRNYCNYRGLFYDTRNDAPLGIIVGSFMIRGTMHLWDKPESDEKKDK
jgi:hypothetical protein